LRDKIGFQTRSHKAVGHSLRDVKYAQRCQAE
jgi:hypothetical protein